jgi:bis(5'-nucleosidyl)-tetraphosphatase
MEIKYDEKSCGIVLFREQDKEKLFLLLHYPGGHWDFPKGHVEEGEEEKETATRELLEETGIADVWFVDGFREEIAYHHGDEKISHKQVIFFLGKTKFQDVRISHEHKAFEWLPYNEAMDRLTYNNAKKY